MSLRAWWDAKVRPWLDDVRGMLKYPGDAPSDPDDELKPPRKANHGQHFTPPHSLADDVERKWPSKEERDQ